MALAPELGKELNGRRYLYPGKETESRKPFSQTEGEKYNSLEHIEKTVP